MPRFVGKPAAAVKPAVAKVSTATLPSPPKSPHRRSLEYQEARGTLRGFSRAELALTREHDAQQARTARARPNATP